MDTDETLRTDPDFAAVCDARRDAWIDAIEHDLHAAEGPLDAAESA